MDGVRFNGEEDGADDGKGEADAEYEGDEVMDSVVEDDGNNGLGDKMQAKPRSLKPHSKQGALKRPRNQTWNRKRGRSVVAANDDEFVPHPFGEGACKEWHFRDDVTEEPYVKVEGDEGQEEMLTLVAGEGIAIGRQPCEFHKNEFGG